MTSRCTEGRQRRFVWTILLVNFLLICSSGSSKPVNILQRNVTNPLEQPPALLTFDDLMKYTTMCSIDDDAGYFRDVILKPMLQVRVSGTEANARVRQHIKSQMLELGWHVVEDAFEANTPLGRRQFTNVVADLDPGSRSRLTLACHYDSKWFGTDGDSVGGGFIGATDAAASCAMMIDLATCLNSTLHNVNSASQTSLQLIFFDGEEAFVSWSEADSLYGSRHLAELMETQRLPTPVNGNLDGRISQLDTMNLMILLDLIGSRDTQFVNWFQETSAFYNRLSQIETELRQAGLLSDGRYFFESNGRPLGRLLEDDHVPFLVRGVPVLHLISYPFPYVWHTEADNETALDYATINDVARILRVFVAEYLGLGVAIASQPSVVAEPAM